jgi:hypothetical protein
MSEHPAKTTAFASLRSLTILAAFAIATFYAFRSGLELRRWMWDYTHWIHFYPDVNNGYFWGSQGNQPAENPQGFLNVYDTVAKSASHRADDSVDYQLDYAPLRLLLMTRWVRWTQVHFPDLAAVARDTSAFGSTPRPWEAPYEFFRPLLQFNTMMEIIAAVGIFLLTRHWVVRGDPPSSAGWLRSPNPFRGWFAGFVAALLFWFNPAMIISAHGWPTWDMWIIPFFVWAVYLACLDFWFCSGLVLAIGAMFKGQQLFVAPMFILWPIFLGKPGKATRWAIGLIVGIAVIVSPWLLSYVPVGLSASDRIRDWSAITWLFCIALSTIAVPIFLRPRRPWRAHSTAQARDWAIWLAILLMAFFLTFWPFLRSANRDYIWIGLAMSAFILIAGQFLSAKRRPFFVMGMIAISILLCAVIFHGSMNWLYIGWGYGTRHYPYMTQGVSDNLAGILHLRFGWENIEDPAWTFAAHRLRLWPTHTILFDQPTVISIRLVLCGLYIVTFLLSVIGIAIQYRRNDPRFLVAITAPWLMFFAFMPQIHERYLLYAACVGSCLTAVSIGTTLINLFFTGLTALMTLHVMLNTASDNGYFHDFGYNVSPTFQTTLLQFIAGTYPDAGWAVLLCAGIFLYFSFAPTPRRPKEVGLVG